MALNPHEDTEFNDALRKHGILPPKTPPPRTPSPPGSPDLEDLLADASDGELREFAEDDARDSDTERAVEAYRRARLAELARETRRGRFGEVYPIGRDDYKREVTEASAVCEDGDARQQAGTGVVCLLYKDAHEPCDRIWPQIRTLARRHPRTKFVSIVGNKCIPDYPDYNLPTIFVYRKGEMSGQIAAWGAKAQRSIDDLEQWLIKSLAIPPDEKPTEVRDRRDDSSDDEPPRTSRIGKANRCRPSDDDSDFDL